MASDNQSDSVETTSTSVVEDSLNISFENITYTVKTGFYTRERKNILNNVHGSFYAGELSVIVGHSGAGKSSLMDILAGYTKPTTGSILINGRVRNERMFRRRSCYILQDDAVQNLLTVHESLTIASELKLGSHISPQQKKQRVQEIITSLNLSETINTKARDLSGGQRKRLAIGLELVHDPPVMFLDEPISGLDSSTSRLIVNLLHQLARQGRTVVVTMHQPSSGLLAMVDRLYAVVDGRCAYIGSVPNLLPFLTNNSFTCPPNHTPLDFLLETLEDLKNVLILVESSKNGAVKDWTGPISRENDKLIESRMSYCGLDVLLTNLPTPKEDQTNKILLALKSTYPTSRYRQFCILTRRSFLATWRDPSQALSIIGIHAGMAFFVGLLFWNINSDAKYIRDNFRFLFFSLMFLMFTAFSSVAVYFPEQISIVRREHFNRWYSAGAYYLSTLAAFLPMQTACTAVFVALTYYATGQSPEPGRVARYSLALLLVSYTALCLGLLNGSIFNTKNGVVFGPLMIMPFTIFSGFFLRFNDTPSWLQWIFHISFLKHGLVGLMMSVFGYKRPKLPCTAIYCHHSNPGLFLKDQGMEDESFSMAILALITMTVCISVLAYVVLKIRLKLKW